MGQVRWLWAVSDLGRSMGIQAVVFDMDGVIIDSEMVWHEVRRDFVVDYGGTWTEQDQKAVMGANSRQWAEHIRDACGVALSPDQIYSEVVSGLREAYREHLPLYEGAREAVQALAGEYRLAVASSSPLELLEYVLGVAGLRDSFEILVSSDEVARAKPEPDVYLEACRRLGCRPECSAAVEDSANGIRAAVAAGLVVIVIPNQAFPPPTAVVESARMTLDSIAELTPGLMEALGLEVCDG